MGRNGELRKRIQKEIPVRIVDRGNKVVILGEAEDTAMVSDVLNELLVAVRTGHTPSVKDLKYALSEAREGDAKDIGAMLGEVPAVLRHEIFVKPKTRGQKRYLEAMRTNTIVMVIGPAGTGKTYLAMAAAVSALIGKEVDRIVLTRPAVEAGESLGFLPGDLQEKVNPYLRPLYDALYSMVDYAQARKYFERDQIEVAPLAFMRGRTLANSFVILDEAQNTTPNQMKMFLTRLGEGSRAVITGDITQTDLPGDTPSGLVNASGILEDTPGVCTIYLGRADVVRHPLVQNIVEAYETHENAKNALDHMETNGEEEVNADPSL